MAYQRVISTMGCPELSLAEAAAPLRSRFEIRVEGVDGSVEVRLRAEGDGGRGGRGVRLDADSSAGSRELQLRRRGQ